jgi:hypothetical protein
VELSVQAAAWLNERLERAYAQHGKLTPDSLEQLDWPGLPNETSPEKLRDLCTTVRLSVSTIATT